MSENFHTPIVPGSQVKSDGPGAGAVNPIFASLDQIATDLNAFYDSGGNLVLPGAWNTKHLVMNGGHLWVEAGSLYYKNGAPTSGTDGTLIAS